MPDKGTQQDQVGHHEHNVLDRLGETCPHCGTHHRVLSSLPDAPLVESRIDSLRERNEIAFIRGIGMMFGETFGLDTDESATEDLVISTSSSTKLLSRHAGTGWVVEQEIEHESDENPTDVGQRVWMDFSSMLSEEISQQFS